MNGSSAHSFNVSFADIQKAFLPPVFGVEFVLAFLGNSLAIWMFLCRDKPWHTGIVYAFSLAVNDLLYVITLPLLILYYSNGKDWVFGEAICKIERFLFTCNLYGSTFLITCISLNRYLGIVHPMFAHNHLQAKHAWFTSLAVWVLASAITSPAFVFSEVKVLRNRSECLGTASDEMLSHYFPYSLFLAALGCAVPFTVTLGSYLSIFRAVHNSQSLKSSEKRRVALLVCVVVVLYAVSFIPYNILRNTNLYRRLHSLDKKPSSIYTAYQVSKGLVTLNMCIHPLLYATLLDNVRGLCVNCTWRKVTTLQS
ncbi:P2Y purinoceptor 11 [Heptranchias perlo]|uniref:P2Y purinoceptor 11 n=1 Tax=Heptranchias perlo TaxID=212740 RepID=UPI00355A21A4